jgi:dTDP-4-amino-4,6-dideoxygalactose transaminase
MTVPLLDLKQQNAALIHELRAAFERVLHSGQFVMGPEVENFEKHCAALLDVRHALGVSSGTDAILLALMALGIGPGDEVVCPSYTFFATAGCIARTGAQPVFCDSCPVTFNVDYRDMAQRITPRTKALMPVHLFGQAADMKTIMELAERHGLPVIEDAAQALSARYQDRAAGTIGAFGTYSFFPSKNLGGFGDGGLLVTNDDQLADQARLLRTHGARPKYFHKYVGGNFRLDPLMAAMLDVKLPQLAEYSARRQQNAHYYTDRLRTVPGIDDGSRIVLPRALDDRTHIWNQYTLRVKNGQRDALQAFLKQHQIGTEIYYPRPMHLQECFATPGQTPEPLPVAEQLAQEALSIPVFPELEPAQLDFVAGTITAFLKGA